MAEYFITEKSPNEWKVSKYKNDTPEGEYMVQQDNMGFFCNCPRWMKRSRTTTCRHTQLVTDWIQQGKPQPYYKEIP